ncbi:vacuolar protein sorting-associated protein 45, putative [Plasmodium berghei]|uniref:Vacuolar protein sorting-associated protein 45, putative n=2 Tax=Plasmodium berghei TaxID=5821 RepID=A0A509AHT9_PLABA|nr:vacuolar protein sorting-associated protein 45, putative [Plasmodium berghei ANKA]CXH96225.1 vacuolar protein sorting-associated protein 45, putative [Plasmodium berghei]SCL91117.1 vacuolar protein sorting-associated protein 45, putative [Plasmodium berghei]SCM15428.1 vacuolar protein sorting-associated protein 45, putative [Plasmodium berghei]SCM17224.1 vacuolar protein sorting-associated protein 45, putative [Plasmodium berghei]SCN22311.1 vacuolar protein sorting-associated protein 45, pu|eukprot:XP_034420014.1 vacuolar protein sorting-associated protein 45, putative [Plasmodium berghei ANKA]
METNPYVFKNLIHIYEEYINLIINRVKGYKVLVLDDETKVIISLIFSHSYILEKEIFLTLNFNDINIFEDIKNGNKSAGGRQLEELSFQNYKIKNLKHLKAIFLLRPTHKNILKLIKELKKPIFLEYYLFFTNILNNSYIEKLAKADEFECIKSVMEYYIDIYVLHDKLFSLNIDYISFLYKNDNKVLLKNKIKNVSGNSLNMKRNIQFKSSNNSLTFEEFNKNNVNYINFNYLENDNDDFNSKDLQNQEDVGSNNESKNMLYEHLLVNRLIEGMFSFLCSIKQVPDIIYNKHSYVCKYIIDALKMKMLKHENIFSNILENYENYDKYTKTNPMENYKENNLLINKNIDVNTEGNCCYMVVLDRKEDPITPLLMQWTYQAMLHELIGIDNNKIILDSNNSEESQIVMSSNYDDFYNEHLFDNFGDLGQAVQSYVDVYQKETARKSKLESIDDIQKFIEAYPNYKKLSGNVTKHVNILHKFSELVEKRKLFHISELEQSIAIYQKKMEHFKQVIETVKNYSYTNYDALRLSLLYSLKYEDKEHIDIIKKELQKRNIEKDQISLIDSLMIYSNDKNRKNNIFKEQTFLDYAKTTITRTIKGASNVFTLHKSYIYYLIDDIIKFKLDTSIYTTTNLLNIAPNMNKQINSIIVFIIGGATYEEYRDVQDLSKKYNINIVLGGTQIHNSQSFLADVLQLTKK